jgi:hypothetical protein
MANALDDVRNTYLTLDQHYNMLLAACPTQNDRDALGVQYATAQKNYYACENQFLAADDAAVASVNEQLQAANKVVSQSEKEMGTITKVLDHISTAIDLGQQLIAKAGL